MSSGVTGCMQLGSVVPALPVPAKCGNGFSYSVSVSSDEPADREHGGVHEAESPAPLPRGCSSSQHRAGSALWQCSTNLEYTGRLKSSEWLVYAQRQTPLRSFCGAVRLQNNRMVTVSLVVSLAGRPPFGLGSCLGRLSSTQTNKSTICCFCNVRMVFLLFV